MPSEVSTPHRAYRPRSVLFVPADRSEFTRKAPLLEADAICFDLEDGVAPSRKDAARAALPEICQPVKAAGKQVIVRINAELDWIGQDIAALPGETDTVLLAKATGARHVRMLEEALKRRFGDAGTAPRIIAAIEDPEAVLAFGNMQGRIPDLLDGLFFGVEDLAVALNCKPDAPLMLSAFHDLARAAAALTLPVFGYPASVSDFTDLDAFTAGVQRGRDAGAVGGFCIHPKQIAVLNRVYASDPAEVDWARRAILAFKAALAQGHGAVSIDGRMVDRPVYEQALTVIRTSGRDD